MAASIKWLGKRGTRSPGSTRLDSLSKVVPALQSSNPSTPTLDLAIVHTVLICLPFLIRLIRL